MVVDTEVVRLIQVTLRTFYEPKFSIVMDQLVRKEAMRDEELAARLGVNTKEAGKLTNKLQEDGFLATHRRNEIRSGNMKATPRTWYYIDYQRTIDVIKWRMFKIRKVIDDKLRNELDQQGYVCPRCKKRFTTLDASALLDFTTNSMRCDICGTEVQDNENVDDVKRSKDQMLRLVRQTKTIVEGLKKTESIPLKHFDIAAWLEKHVPIAANDTLPIPSSSGPQEVKIELVGDPDELAARAKKEADAESKRVQNALPSWIERSTITGELTAVGAAQQAVPDASAQITIEKDGGSSPTKNAADDDLDAYYANLAAQQAATEFARKAEGTSPADVGQGSPSSLGGSANVKLADSGYEDFGDDLGAGGLSPAEGPSRSLSRSHSKLPSLRPPSSTANSLGKRSREPSEESDSSRKYSRSDTGSRVDTPTAVVAREDSVYPAATEQDGGSHGDDGPEDAGDEQMLTVQGKPMRFSDITDGDTEQMTAEEYEAYFAVLSGM